ncbi:MAG: Zinc ribbon domain protein [Planctomycetes bacterium ADurb.Bin401]|nr:MAG: Zinc ribbon domain protein [Planctomycetes bacterium ADurb.Bin401]
MPTYDYRCENCNHHFEKFQSITASAMKKCPKCGKSTLVRLIGTGAAVIFKGSGFYQTDYRSDSYTQASKKESESGTKKEEKTETKSEAKSETKTETKSETKKTETKSEKPKEKKK